jgi:hypothetical protein
MFHVSYITHPCSRGCSVPEFRQVTVSRVSYVSLSTSICAMTHDKLASGVIKPQNHSQNHNELYHRHNDGRLPSYSGELYNDCNKLVRNNRSSRNGNSVPERSETRELKSTIDPASSTTRAISERVSTVFGNAGHQP